MKFVSRTKSMAVPHQIHTYNRKEKRELLMCGHLLIVRLTIAIFVFQMLGVTSVVRAERPDSTAGTSSAGTRKLFIGPSSTSVALGKASLIVSPLTHRDGNYVGDYQLKVKPYFFKSEKGSLLLAASDDAVGSCRREQPSTLPVRPSRTKTAELISCLGGQHRHHVTAGASHFLS